MTRKRSETFDEVAPLYDRARPGYPDALIQTVVDTTGLPDNARILEIGTGTGKATLPFARRGYVLHGVEPGRNLAAVAAANLRAYPNLTLHIARFEDWPLPQQPFDLVMSAQAFHWIASEIRFVKSAAALRAGGWLALFWNEGATDNSPLFAEIQAAYHTYAPQIARVVNTNSYSQGLQKRAEDIRQSGLFQSLTVHEFPWSQSYTAVQYLELLDTYSDHRLLPDAEKRSLYEKIAQIINAQGGRLARSYVAVLYLAQKPK
jgi:ubiquinone/menaquinone biosynthesis C-methylase UbiE